MKTIQQYRLRIPALAAAFLLSGGVLMAVGPDAAPATGPVAASPWGASYFPNVTFTTQDGKTVRLYDDLLKDKNVIVNFIYTQCSASCPLETAKLAQVQNVLGSRMGRDVFFLSFSLDPKRDTPEALKAYAEKFHAGPGWIFLTGAKSDIELVRRKLGQAARPGENELVDHSTSFMIGNATTGQWMTDGPMDDPRYIAAMVGEWLTSWKGRRQGKSYAEVPPLEGVAEKGAYLFKTRCSACHTLGKGDQIGPDLLGVTGLRERAWLSRYLKAPDEMLAAGDPLAVALFEKYNQVRMPNLRLSERDVETLIQHLEARTAASHGNESIEYQPKPAGGSLLPAHAGNRP